MAAEADERRELPIVLGSGSPRRSELLALAGIEFDVVTAAVDERPLIDSDVAASAARSARAKFNAIRSQSSGPAQGRTLLTADTLVAAGSRVLGKPDDLAHAREMLVTVSGATLQIVSALCLSRPGGQLLNSEVITEVTLTSISAGEIDAYLATGATHDKAGGLELQGRAGPFIESLDGCWSNVVGLPICAVRELIFAAAAAAAGSDAGLTPCSGRNCGRR